MKCFTQNQSPLLWLPSWKKETGEIAGISRKRLQKKPLEELLKNIYIKKKRRHSLVYTYLPTKIHLLHCEVPSEKLILHNFWAKIAFKMIWHRVDLAVVIPLLPVTNMK